MFPQDEYEMEKMLEDEQRDREQIERANIELSDWNLAPLIKGLFGKKSKRGSGR